MDVERCLNMKNKVKECLSKLEWNNIRFEEESVRNSVEFNMACGKYRATIYPDDGFLILYFEAYENDNEFEFFADPVIFLDYDPLIHELKRISDM